MNHLKKEWNEAKKKIEKDSWESGERAGQLLLLKFAIKVNKELGIETSDLENTLNKVEFGKMLISKSHINIISNDLDNNLRES